MPLVIDKPEGWTPLEAVRWAGRYHLKDKSLKLGYAGRLDPLASGVLLLMVGPENRHRQSFLNLPKTYRVKLLLCLASDTYDPLGLLTKINLDWTPKQLHQTVSDLSAKTGKHTQAYPPFSSKTVHGKPLFTWARQGQIPSLRLPSRSITIHKISYHGYRLLPLSRIVDQAARRVKRVRGDFRQSQIIASWNRLLSSPGSSELPLLDLTFQVSSGTYIRSLVHQAGQASACGALAWKIRRTRVGPYRLKDSLTPTNRQAQSRLRPDTRWPG